MVILIQAIDVLRKKGQKVALKKKQIEIRLKVLALQKINSNNTAGNPIVLCVKQILSLKNDSFKDLALHLQILY